MSRGLCLCLLLGISVEMWARPQQSPSGQSSSSNGSSDSTPPSETKPADAKPKKSVPNLAPPRSDRVDAGSLNDEIGESSSKDTQIDLSPPENDARAHPESSVTLEDAGSGSGVGEFHIWDPHKAAKSVEVGDFYFKRKNYRAAEDRYREALRYKDNDAIATFRLAVCLEKLEHSEDARAEYESYLKILPHGPQADEAQKSLERLKASAAKATK